MLHFAYGSNMHCGVMRKHAPTAMALGMARLADYRFVITSDGYASVAPARRRCVYGMLWRLTPRDRVTLDLWENIAAGQYRAENLPVLQDGRRRPALVYVARRG
ncbi:MAG: gamma-glutamylcyclotransferase family protein, partial [Xanthobacteraceae bacterium]